MNTTGRILKTSVFLIGFYCLFLTTIFGQKVRIMPLGDSITKGMTSQDNTGFRRYLFNLLTGNGFNISFVGSQALGIPTDFDRSCEAYSGWFADNDPDTSLNNNIATHVYNWLTKSPADMVILHIGTNDIDDGASSDQVVKNIGHIIDEIDRYETDNSRAIKIVICQIINRADVLNNSKESKVTSDFNNKLKVMVDNRLKLPFPDKIYLVNLEKGAGLNYNIDFQSPFAAGDMSDLFHPNDKGYKKIAIALYKTLRTILKKDTSPAIKTGNPADASTNVYKNVTLNWNSSINPVTFRLQLAKDSIFEKIYIDNQTLTDTSALITNLADTTDYYWRVIGINSNGKNIAYSRFSGFRTALNKIIAPRLLYPENNSTNLDTKLIIKWNNSFDVESYIFQLASDSGFTALLFTQPGLKDTLIQLTNLKAGTLYFWRIIAKGYSESEVTSEVRNFITTMNPPQNLKAIEDSVKNIMLSWQYSDDNSPGFIIERKVADNTYSVIDTIKSSTTHYLDSTSDINLTYTYRVKAFDRYTVSNYSNEYTLLVSTVSDKIKIDKFYLFQNYPNPFNPSTTISYQLPEFSHVELRVYNIIGQEIAVLVNKDQNAGRYEVKFPAENSIQGTGRNSLPTGLYIYQLQTKTYNETRKMLLIK